MKYILIIALALGLTAGIASAVKQETIFNPDGTITYCYVHCDNAGNCYRTCH